MLTNKGKYGLKAMTHLAAMPPGQPALVADIAAANAIPKKFLDAILGELRTAGFVHSKKGRGGGYVLARSPDEIRVGEIVRALDGMLAPDRLREPRLLPPLRRLRLRRRPCGVQNRDGAGARRDLLRARRAHAVADARARAATAA